jgi:hypothetical protein
LQLGKQPLDKLYAGLIEPILYRMRRYHYDSLLDALLKRLNQPQTSNGLINDLQRLPWVVERLLILLLADKRSQYRYCFNGEIDDHSLDGLIFNANQSVSSLYKYDIKIQTTSLFMRQAFLSQIPYQKNLDTHDFVLQLYFIAKLDLRSNLLKYLNKRAGMPVELYFQMALLFWTYTSTDAPWFNKSYIDSMLHIFPENELNVFLNSITSSVQDLNKKLSERTIELDEWFQPVIFYKTPCILFENTIIPFGRPTLRRYFENLIGDWLEEENGKCLRDYDALIHDYVQDGLVRCQVDFLGESDINKLTNSKDRVCDYLIDEHDGFILVEVKNKSLTKKIPSSSHPVPITSKLDKTVVSGISQLDITFSRVSKLPRFKNRHYHRIIVTKNDLWLGNIDAFSSNLNDVDPIWLLTLSDMDHLVELVREKRATFCSFFEDLSARRKVPSESVFTASMLLEKHPYKFEQLPSHLLAEADKVIDVLKERISIN